MFNRYYQSELTYLRELGMDFAESHPDLASHFEGRGDDPDVDRLLEGFAFLSARMRQRLDDAVPELVDQLAQLLIPHHARIVPAASIVEFTPAVSSLRSRHRIEAGAEVASRPVRGTRCRFRTTRTIDLLPLSVQQAQLDRTVTRAPVLTLGFETVDEGGGPVYSAGGVELFLHGQLAQTSSLLLWFLRHVDQVTFRASDGYTQSLPVSSVTAPGLTADAGIVPWPRLANTGTQLLQTYFNLPEAMLFVGLDGLQAVPAEHATRNFELSFRFHRPPPLPERVEPDQFRPNCVPVVNLFKSDGEPLKRDALGREELVRAAGMHPHHVAIYSVDSVVGIRARRRDRFQYPPFFDFAHAAPDAQHRGFYTLRRTHSPVDNGLDCYLTVSQPPDSDLELEEETLSLELTCTNRELPTDLHIGDINVATRTSPSGARFRNITSVSVPVVPPLGGELHWRLVSHLALNQRTLGNAENLRGMLQLYNFHTAQQQQGRTNRKRSESVRGVAMDSSAQLVGGAMVRGVETTVTVDETRLSGAGDAFLLGCALDALLGGQVPINSFNQLVLSLHPSAAVIEWPAKNGQLPLL